MSPLPEIILSDYDLPRYNGALALAKARETCPDIPFILVTGAVSEDRAIEILTRGAKDYVLKSRLQQRLVPAVQRALGEAEEHKARKKAEAQLRRAHRSLENQVKKRTAELQNEIAGHKRAMEELRESEEKFRAAFHSSAVPMVMTALDGRLIMANEAFAEMLGYSESELVGKLFTEITHPDDIKAHRTAAAPVISGEEPSLRMEKRYLRKDGQSVWAELSTSSVCDAGGKPLYLVTCAQNITERKQAEDSLQMTLHRIHALVSHMHSSILFVREDRIELANQAFCDYFGVEETPDDLIGLTSREVIEKIKIGFLHPEEQIARIREIIRRGQPVIAEEIAMQGGRTYLRDYIPVNINGKEHGHLWNHTDITEQKKLEAEHARLASFPILNPDPIIEMDLEGVVYFYNPGAEKAFPGLCQENQGHPLMADLKSFVSSFREMGSKELTREVNLDDRWYQQVIHFVKETKRIRIYMHDITLLKEFEAELIKRATQLEDINKELESFNYTVSHDLQAPLRAIKGFSQIILTEEEGTTAETKRKLAVILDNAERMQQLIDDLLTLSRVGRQKVSFNPIDMNALVKDVWKELKAAYPEKSLKLKMKDLQPAYGEQTLIRQVLPIWSPMLSSFQPTGNGLKSR